MQPELPETYYLDNVQTLFAHVTTVYADILATAQLEFLAQFSQLGADARKLCIRLLNRSHDCYRVSKLNYPEIDSMTAAINELAQADFIEVNGILDPASLLSLFTKAELLAAMNDKSGCEKLKRGQLEARLLQQNESRYFARLQAGDDLLQLRRRDEYQIIQMLFFGNLNQSMTDFVLRDLGLYQFETYTIDPAHRPYRSQLEIRQHWQLYQLQIEFELSDITEHSVLQAIIEKIPQNIAPETPAARKSERLRYRVARQLERNGELQAATALYRQCQLPPSRERIARLQDRRQQHRQAFAACLDMIAQPLDEQELQFASMFAARLAKRHGFDAPPAVARNRISHQPETVELEIEYQTKVEIAVAEYYAALAGANSCFYLENSLFNGVLGLLIWEVVFAPLPGAFYNPFQFRPSDFYAHDFCARRAELLTDIWDSIDNNQDIWRIVAQRWQQKYGLMNPLVNWQELELGLIQRALDRIDYGHWRAIFDRILRDLQNHRAGFPDLVYFPPTGGYCLIEVKGPGDKLQTNQQRWMQYFHEQGIPHQVARVTWRSD